MRALVTGATGCVGHALSLRLLEIGWPTRALVRPGAAQSALRESRIDALRESRIDALRAAGASVCAGELADPNQIAAAADGCELIFHCASEGSPQASPRVLRWVNIAGTENVIRAARHAGVVRVVHLSCADVTLTAGDRIHWKEDVALGRAPLGELARTKLLAEELALQASDATLTVTAIRPALLWGPGEQRLMPALCAEDAAGGVRLWGSGDNLLATTHVQNVVDALVAAAQADDVGGQSFHVADEESHTAREFIGRLCQALSLRAPRRGIFALAYARATLRKAAGGDGPWPEDVVRRACGCLLDCLQAHARLDYSPSTSFEEGMEELEAWAREQGGAQAIAQLARGPASEVEVEHQEALAAALERGP